MQKNKLVWLIMGCFFINTMHAYNIMITNATNSQIEATIELAATSNTRHQVIPAGQSWPYKSGIYCVDRIRAVATSGPLQGKRVSENPPATGFGIGCKNIKATVRSTADNRLVIEFD